MTDSFAPVTGDDEPEEANLTASAGEPTGAGSESSHESDVDAAFDDDDAQDDDQVRSGHDPSRDV